MDLEDPLEESMATHSSILAWRIPRTEEDLSNPVIKPKSPAFQEDSLPSETLGATREALSRS